MFAATARFHKRALQGKLSSGWPYGQFLSGNSVLRHTRHDFFRVLVSKY